LLDLQVILAALLCLFSTCCMPLLQLLAGAALALITLFLLPLHRLEELLLHFLALILRQTHHFALFSGVLSIFIISCGVTG